GRSRRARLAAGAASAGLLAAVPLLSACGGAPHPGAAAVVDGRRITVSQLQAQVRDVRDAQRESPQAEQLIAASGRLGQNTLMRMIRARVIERAAKDAGVGVSRRDVQQARGTDERQAGGGAALAALYLDQGVAPGQIDGVVRTELLRERLLDKLGTDGAKRQFDRTFKALDIEVNPRYGRWDPERGTTVLADDPWLRPAADADRVNPGA
ncbi:SurA N-terminal domain-containing protein, partial [Streptomyces sp. B1866]|uniref:SurA N-terminal domain-containing protein n=1 Tax=Streptomyces sp. B1866 TaxID=3075431 RepID=UPI00288DE216